MRRMRCFAPQAAMRRAAEKRDELAPSHCLPEAQDGASYKPDSTLKEADTLQPRWADVRFGSKEIAVNVMSAYPKADIHRHDSERRQTHEHHGGPMLVINGGQNRWWYAYAIGRIAPAWSNKYCRAPPGIAAISRS
jgi:hypothetical protein